jgi:phosphatidyl-myo-inositol dimannoside synthase
VTPDFPPARGGIQVLIYGIVRNLSHLHARVVTRATPKGASFDKTADLDVHRVPAFGASHRVSIALLNPAAALEALRFRPRVVLNAHIVTAPAVRVASRLLGVPYVQYLHASEVDFRPRLAAFAVRGAAATIAVSAHTAGLARQAGAPAERVHVIPPGVDLVPVPSEPRLERPTVVCVSRLDDRYKGHDVLLRAMRAVRERVPDAQLILVGGGRLRTELEDLGARLGLDGAVTFLGTVPDAERDRWLARAHVFCMPSRRPPEGGGEGFGIAYLEAAIHELPVIAGDVAGARDAVVHEETGLLVDPQDDAAVAAAIVDLLLDRERAERFGRAARARAGRYRLPAIARRVEDLLLQVSS